MSFLEQRLIKITNIDVPFFNCEMDETLWTCVNEATSKNWIKAYKILPCCLNT